MAIDQTWVFGAGLLAGMAGTAVAGWLMLSRRLKQERVRMQLMEQARHLAAQQLTQARKQIEQLQRECHELKLALRPNQPHPAAPHGAPAAPAFDATESARHRAGVLMRAEPEDKDEPTGFADTQILRPGARS